MKDLKEYLRDRYITKRREMLDVLARAVCDSELLKGERDRTGWIYRIYSGSDPADLRTFKVSEKIDSYG